MITMLISLIAWALLFYVFPTLAWALLLIGLASQLFRRR